MNRVSLVRLGSIARTWASFSLRRLDRPPLAPLMVYVEVTRKCPFRCLHCGIWRTCGQSSTSHRHELSAEALVGQLARLVPKGLMAVDLFGGEPLMRPDLEYIVAGLTRRGLHVTVTTNGWLLTRERALSLIDNGVSQILVSVDGTNETTHDRLRGVEGSYQQAVRAVREVAEVGRGRVSVGINCLVCGLNINELAGMADLAAELGAGGLRLLPWHDCSPFSDLQRPDDLLVPGSEQLPELESGLKVLQARAAELGLTLNMPAYLASVPRFFAGALPKSRCSAGWLVCDIDAFGNLYACFTQGRAAGSLWESTFDDLWLSSVMKNERSRALACSGCWQSCYVEPALRAAASQGLGNLWGSAREFLRYLR